MSKLLKKTYKHYQGKVYDLSIANSHTYNIEGKAVHNSSAGALISYSLGICQTDPVKWGLLFERFLTTPPASGYAVVGKDLGGVKAKVNKVAKVEIELDDGTCQTLYLTEDLAKGLEIK